MGLDGGTAVRDSGIKTQDEHTMAEKLRQEDSSGLESTTVGIFRTAKTVKGGRNFTFAALVVVGDRGGNVGIGYGKGPGVPAGIEKAQKDAKKSMFPVTLNGGTVPHEVTGRFKSSTVRLIPAAPGTGVIAGGTVRAVLEMAGVQDCLTKAYGSTNKINLSKAVVDGLQQLRTRDEVARLRGVEIASTSVDEVLEANKRLLEAAEAKVPKPEPKPTKADAPKQKQADDAPAAQPTEGAAATAAAVAEPPAEDAPAEKTDD